MKQRWMSALIGVLLAATMLPANASISDGLVGYWSFDNCDAQDGSGNGNNGTVHGSPVCTSGSSGSAYRFNGTTDYIVVPNASSFPSSAITTSFWINREGNTINGRWENILSKEYSFQNYAETGSSNCTNCVSFGLWKGSSGIWSANYTSSNSLAATGWIHFTFTFDNTTRVAKSYINGVLVATVNESDSSTYVRTSSNSLYIGRNGSAAVYYLKGLLDEVRVYNRALSDTEIQQLYSNNSCSTTDTTAAYNQGYAAAQAACQTNPSSCGITAGTSSTNAAYDPLTNTLRIPAVDIPNAFGSPFVFSVDLSVINSNPLQFQLRNAAQIR